MLENRQPAFIYFISLQIGARWGHKILATCLNHPRQLLQGCKNEKLITITDWVFSSSWLYLEQDIGKSWQSRKYYVLLEMALICFLFSCGIEESNHILCRTFGMFKNQRRVEFLHPTNFVRPSNNWIVIL